MAGHTAGKIVDVQAVFEPVGAHQVNSAIAAATPLVPPSADVTKLLIQALAQNVRLTLDGTAPSAATGFQLKAGDPAVLIPISQATSVKVIEEAASATIQFQWGK